MRPRFQNTISLALTSLFLILMPIVAVCSKPSTGLDVWIARPRECGLDDKREIVVYVRPHGQIGINQEYVTRNELDGRLQKIFRTRVQRLVLVKGASDVSYGEVTAVIDSASKYADHMALLVPSIKECSEIPYPMGIVDAYSPALPTIIQEIPTWKMLVDSARSWLRSLF